MLSRPVDLLFGIVEIHLPTSRTVIGGIEKLSSGLGFLPHKLLSKEKGGEGQREKERERERKKETVREQDSESETKIRRKD